MASAGAGDQVKASTGLSRAGEEVEIDGKGVEERCPGIVKGGGVTVDGRRVEGRGDGWVFELGIAWG